MIMNSIPRNPIVDTGPLFDFLLWQYSIYSRIPNLIPKLRYLTYDSRMKSAQWYFGVAKPITTCPEVIAEIHRLAEGKLEGRNLGSFWRFVQAELRELGLSEKMVELVKMEGDTLSDFGPTDTALLYIADLSSGLGLPVFTADYKLAGQCRKRQLSVLDMDEVLSLWQQYEGR